MFKYRFECPTCEKHIEFRAVPLLPTCPVCMRALEIEAMLDGETWAAIPHAVLVDFELDHKLLEFVEACSGVPRKDIQSRLTTTTEATHAFRSVKQLCMRIVMSSEKEIDYAEVTKRMVQEQQMQAMIDNMDNVIKDSEGL